MSASAVTSEARNRGVRGGYGLDPQPGGQFGPDAVRRVGGDIAKEQCLHLTLVIDVDQWLTANVAVHCRQVPWNSPQGSFWIGAKDRYGITSPANEPCVPNGQAAEGLPPPLPPVG